MGKVKSSETLSLDKSKQKKVVKQTKKLKKDIGDGKISIKRSLKTGNVQNRGLIYIGHIPHGFYENEMKKYFKQFGAVTNVKVCRSNRSGNSKGFGYVEFSHPEVAKIAAETMNNYLMFKKRLVAEYVPSEKRPQYLFKGRSSTVKRYSAKVRLQKQRLANSKVDQKTHLKRTSARLSRLNKKLAILKDHGMDYDFKPVDVPQITRKVTKTTIEKKEEVVYTFEQDPYDSDIEVKIPVKSKTPKKPPKKVSGKTATAVKSKLSTPRKITKPKSETPKNILKRKPQTPKKTPLASNVRTEISAKLKSVTKKSPKKVISQQTPTPKLSKGATPLKKTKTETPKKTPSRTISKQTPKTASKPTPKQKGMKRKSIH